MERVSITLKPREWDEFNRLRPLPGEARDFWRKVADARDLDPETVIEFTALPNGHGKHWCYPTPLKCRKRP